MIHGAWSTFGSEHSISSCICTFPIEILGSKIPYIIFLVKILTPISSFQYPLSTFIQSLNAPFPSEGLYLPAGHGY